MDLKPKLLAHSDRYKQDFLPHLSIDSVVFGFRETALQVLLVRLQGSDKWSLPGGYVGKDESTDDAAVRILKERTNAENIYLQQFRSFGDLNRSESFFADFADCPDDLWFRQRFVSLGYYALVNFEAVSPLHDEFSEECAWKSVDELPDLMMDHRYIFDKALMTLRKQLNYKPIGLNLLSEKFTMPELQRLYETILGKKLNRGNFYRKMLRFDILIKQEESRKGGAHKAPNLYSFNVEKYRNALKNGLQAEW